jgi:NAD(P)-dependent dehydrogenase (short-subunit alcohol dehydrogenase family)
MSAMSEPKVAVVTGAASGVGAAVARTLEARGVIVRPADLSLQGPGRVDLTELTSVQDFTGRVADEQGRCDILINCAGAIAVGRATECSEEDWEAVFAVNVRGAWRMAKHLIPLMSPGSAIVNVSSGAGLRAIPDMAAYVASKHAVVGLTRAMALDHAQDGIRVNCVCPGLVDTPMARRAQDQRPSTSHDAVAAFDGYLIKRAAHPSEIAESICFLASDASTYTTGVCLAVDGGRSMH